MTNKQCMATLLRGGIPDYPPHWELVFQLEKEMFGVDMDAIANACYPTEAVKIETICAHYIETRHRLIDEFGWAAVAGYSPEEVAALKKEVGQKALVFTFDWGGVFWMPTGDKLMDFVVRMFERPDEMHAEARQKCDEAKQHFRRHADAGVDFFVLAYDFGFNDASFIAPWHFREFVTPYLAECVQAVHDLGKVAILHSDGCLSGVLDQIHSTGIDGYQSIDPQAHMDIKAVREQYPDWLLMGNVECRLLQDGSEEQIRDAVGYCMQHGGIGRRYIFSTSNCLFAGMPPHSYRIMLDEYRACLRQRSVHSQECGLSG